MSEHTNETTILNLQEALRRVVAERDELRRTVPVAQMGVVAMTADELIAAVNYFAHQQAERILTLNKQVSDDSETIEQLQQQLAERDARIAELERAVAERDVTIDGLYSSAGQYQRNWLALRDATECECQLDALEWIKRHRAADQQPAPAPEPSGELVAWDAETRPRGVVMFRFNSTRHEAVLRYWSADGAGYCDAFRDWTSLLSDAEWSRDGVNWHPCGTRKGVQA